MVATKFSELTPADFDSVSKLHHQELHLADDGNDFDGLEELTTYQRVTAESRIIGQTLDARCQSVASILGVNAKELTKIVMSWLGKLPSSDVNRYVDRDDVEQRIYIKLIANVKNRGNWEWVKTDVACAYIDWYRQYKRNGAIYLEQLSIDLDRQAHLDATSDSLAESIPDMCDYLGEIEDKIWLDGILVALPKPIAKILGMRLVGTPITAVERKRWQRFMAHQSNVDGILGLLYGHTNVKPTWVYQAERGAPKDARRIRSQNGPVVIVTPA